MHVREGRRRRREGGAVEWDGTEQLTASRKSSSVLKLSSCFVSSGSIVNTLFPCESEGHMELLYHSHTHTNTHARTHPPTPPAQTTYTSIHTAWYSTTYHRPHHKHRRLDLVVLEESPKLLQPIEKAVVVVLERLALEVTKYFLAIFLL